MYNKPLPSESLPAKFTQLMNTRALNGLYSIILTQFLLFNSLKIWAEISFEGLVLINED